MRKDHANYAKDAHDYSTQARASSDGHSRDMEEMQQLSMEAAENLKQGQKRQRRRRESRNTT